MTAKTPEAVKFCYPKCSSGKIGWASRKGAKQFNSQVTRRGGDRLRPYLHEECGYWHLGHLPRAVRQGIVTAAEHYSTKTTDPAIEATPTPKSQKSDWRAA